jgi:multiple sugar transport system permease protein
MNPLAKYEYRVQTNTALMLAPWIATFIAFWMYPLGYALYLSFTNYNTLTNDAVWNNFDNYLRIWDDDTFWTALTNTSLFTFGTIPLTTAFALVLAVLLNGNIRLKSFFRAAYFLPSVTSLVVVSLIFTNLYSASGYVNMMVNALGLPYPTRGWLQEPSTALGAIMAMDVWLWTGYYMVLLLAALQTIPNDLYEAAELSGASKLQQFRMITVPMLRPSLVFVFVINTIKSFQIFVEIYVMTKGGPLDATTTMVYMIYVNAFERQDMMGYACAVGYVVFFIILAFALVQMYFLQAGKAAAD